ncbi:PREDICTED: uncharacterized protein LOC102241242 [Myotis brandtii]|uniref:uncharacterized protein LOC102241242 n=1 Tax=Myotis brandtii TaxID=109478 RepID=UPI0007044484|nr:PREDICTED: uncharacterized protein LOC102241242 [Myotis brandtii]
MNLRMFLHACVHMCVLCTHHYIHDTVYNIFLFIDIHVYAQYMCMIQYTETNVLHVGPVTACIVLHMEYSCICHVHALPQWTLPMCVHTLYKNKRLRTCMPSTCLAESFMMRTCMYIHAPQCACQQVVSVHTHPCMCPGAHREGGSVQSHMHVHLHVTCTMLVPGQAYTCTHADLMGQVHGIYAMSCACGRRVYTTCIGPQVNTCSMHGPGRTHVCSHHGNTCVHGRPEPCPQGPALEKGVGRAQGESCWCQDSDGAQTVPPASGVLSLPGGWAWPPPCGAPGACLAPVVAQPLTSPALPSSVSRGQKQLS